MQLNNSFLYESMVNIVLVQSPENLLDTMYESGVYYEVANQVQLKS